MHEMFRSNWDPINGCSVVHDPHHIPLCSLYRLCEPVGVSQAEALKEENDSLRCQLDAYRNEVELLKQEQGKNHPMSSEEDTTHSQQLSFLQQALQGMQKVSTRHFSTHLACNHFSLPFLTAGHLDVF